jgi:hypothetical protein
MNENFIQTLLNKFAKCFFKKIFAQIEIRKISNLDNRQIGSERRKFGHI